jgi:hypothetical protein
MFHWASDDGIGRACSTHGERGMYIEFLWDIQMERDYCKDYNQVEG